MKIITAHQAIDTYIKDGMTLGLGGFVGAAPPKAQSGAGQQAGGL